MVEVMRRFPEGISAAELGRELEREGLRAEDLRNLRGRIGELGRWFVIEEIRATKTASEGRIAEALRARVLLRARSRCQCCGKSIQADRIALAVDLRMRGCRGDTAEADSWWAICEACHARRAVRPIDPTTSGARPRLSGCRMSKDERWGDHRLDKREF